MRSESITVVDVKQPGAIVKNRKDQFLISMFSSIHSAYSPIAITLREVKQHNYNLLEYLFSLIQNYDARVPTTLTITFGETGKSTKKTGDLLRKYVSSYEGLCTVIGRFYQQPTALSIMQAGHAYHPTQFYKT